ncbi:MAG TPA: alpha/beta hydrolase [Longimicrobium sp.]|nr:alpha/beta hydrolase [Longimicrobium sp.]
MSDDSAKVMVLLVPGIWNSGPEHWQSYWERERGDCVRVEQEDWEAPRRAEWVASLGAAIASAPGEVVLAAHSLGCATVAHWAAGADPSLRAKVRGALLVAPADVDRPGFPAPSFAPMPMTPLPFRTTLVASTNDEWLTIARAAELAAAWESRLVNAGALGHINSASELGMWPLGQQLLAELAG